MTNNPQLGDKRQAQLEPLQDLPNDHIDTSDIPEVLDWSGARYGLFYRPVKQQITLHLDADLNRALRMHVERCERKTT